MDETENSLEVVASTSIGVLFSNWPVSHWSVGVQKQSTAAMLGADRKSIPACMKVLHQRSIWCSTYVADFCGPKVYSNKIQITELLFGKTKGECFVHQQEVLVSFLTDWP